jgi:hypothetical protein
LLKRRKGPAVRFAEGLGNEQRMQIAPENVVAGIAEHPLGRFVPEHSVPGFVEHDDCVMGGRGDDA